MAQEKREIGTIYITEGIGKNSNKPYTALILEAGTWSKLYFPESRFEMDYIKSLDEQDGSDDSGNVPVNRKTSTPS